jgi:hypothetical protein
LTGGRIAARGSILGNLSINGSIDSQSAIVAGGSIGSASYNTSLTVGDVSGILAAVEAIRVNKIGSTSAALFYQPNDMVDAGVIDSIFTEGVSPLSTSDLFDRTSPEDLQNLSQMLVNLSNLTVKNRQLYHK